MAVSLESIELLREKTRVSYEDAKLALEACDGDIVEALVYLEKQGKIKPPQKEEPPKEGFGATLKKLVKASNETRFIVSKKGNPIINLSLTIVILVTLFVPPLTIIGLLLALFSGHTFRMERPNHAELKINKTFDDVSAAAAKVSAQVSDAMKDI